MEEIDARLTEAEQVKSNWTPVQDLVIDSLSEQMDELKVTITKALSALRRRILKVQLFYTVRSTLHTNLSRKWSFSKTLFKRYGKLKTPAFRFSADGVYFENGGFRKRCTHDNHVTEFSSNTNPK